MVKIVRVVFPPESCGGCTSKVSVHSVLAYDRVAGRHKLDARCMKCLEKGEKTTHAPGCLTCEKEEHASIGISHPR